MTRWVTEATPVSSAERRAIGPANAPPEVEVVVDFAEEEEVVAVVAEAVRILLDNLIYELKPGFSFMRMSFLKIVSSPQVSGEEVIASVTIATSPDTYLEIANNLAEAEVEVATGVAVAGAAVVVEAEAVVVFVIIVNNPVIL